jgi:hypothetical protein
MGSLRYALWILALNNHARKLELEKFQSEMVSTSYRKDHDDYFTTGKRSKKGQWDFSPLDPPLDWVNQMEDPH